MISVEFAVKFATVQLLGFGAWAWLNPFSLLETYELSNTSMNVYRGDEATTKCLMQWWAISLLLAGSAMASIWHASYSTQRKVVQYMMIGTLMAIYATYKNLNFAGESKNMVYFGFFHQLVNLAVPTVACYVTPAPEPLSHEPTDESKLCCRYYWVNFLGFCIFVSFFPDIHSAIWFNGANKLFGSAEGQHLMLWFGVGLLNASAFFMAMAQCDAADAKHAAKYIAWTFVLGVTNGSDLAMMKNADMICVLGLLMMVNIGMAVGLNDPGSWTVFACRVFAFQFFWYCYIIMNRNAEFWQMYGLANAKDAQNPVALLLMTWWGMAMGWVATLILAVSFTSESAQKTVLTSLVPCFFAAAYYTSLNLGADLFKGDKGQMMAKVGIVHQIANAALVLYAVHGNHEDAGASYSIQDGSDDEDDTRSPSRSRSPALSKRLRSAKKPKRA